MICVPAPFLDSSQWRQYMCVYFACLTRQGSSYDTAKKNNRSKNELGMKNYKVWMGPWRATSLTYWRVGVVSCHLAGISSILYYTFPVQRGNMELSSSSRLRQEQEFYLASCKRNMDMLHYLQGAHAKAPVLQCEVLKLKCWIFIGETKHFIPESMVL